MRRKDGMIDNPFLPCNRLARLLVLDVEAVCEEKAPVGVEAVCEEKRRVAALGARPSGA